MPELFGYDVQVRTAIDTLLRVFAGPLNFLDTSNEYAAGESERRIGLAIKEAGGLPEGFVLATKVDPDPDTGDFSGARVRRSVDESLDRLGLDRLDLVYLHDPERVEFDYAFGTGGPVDGLRALRTEGVVRHIGVAGGPIDLMRRYVGTGVFEVVITHNRFTLLDRSAEVLLAESAERGIPVVNAAPFGGGLLAKGPAAQPKYAYAMASDRLLAAVRRMSDACRVFDVPLSAAALQFSMHDSRVASTIVGMSAPERIEQTITLAQVAIPTELWDALNSIYDDHVAERV
jgi:D-threo-aldose 1-dehydrogenase